MINNSPLRIDLKVIKNIKYTFFATLLALCLECIDYYFGYEISDIIQKKDILLDLLLISPFLGIGASIDFYLAYKSKKEAEKVAIYMETLHSISYHLRNLLNNMQLMKISESIKSEFGEDIIEMLQKTEDETVKVLKELKLLSNITPENIKEIAERNIQ